MVRRTYRTKRRGAVIRRVGYKTRGKTGKHYPVIYKLPVGMPERYTCKLKYNGLFTLNAPVGTPAVQAFRMNSLQDYDLTGGGHQPTPFDQLASFYKKYFVRSAKVIISPLRTTGDSAVNGFVCFGASLQPTSGITAGLTWDDLMQAEKTTQRINNK